MTEQEANRLESLVKVWRRRGGKQAEFSERTEDETEQRLAMHGAYCYFNCSAELDAELAIAGHGAEKEFHMSGFRKWLLRPMLKQFGLVHSHLSYLKGKIMATQAELTQGLNDLTAQVTKIGAETAATLQKVSDLEAAIAGAGGVDPSVQAAFDALKAQVQAVDDAVADAPVTPPADSPATP
jgi:hypothetical protein